MKKLENKTVDSKREMDILDALQDIRARNARNERVGHSDDLLSKIQLEEVVTEEDLQRQIEEDEDERLVRQVFSKIDVPETSASGSTSAAPRPQMTVKRKADGEEPDLHDLLPDTARDLIASKTALVAPIAKKKRLPDKAKSSLGIKLGKSKGKAIGV
jgi:hypothetical protein